MKLFWFNFILTIFVADLLGLGYVQANSVVLLDRKYENETYYYDLSYVNSNFHNYDTIQSKYSLRDRSGTYTNKNSCGQIKSIPSNIRNDLKLKYFYQKFTEAYGIPIIGSNKVTANGLRRSCYVLRFFLASNLELRDAFYKKNVRIVVMSSTENLLNVPELAKLPASWATNVRGLSPTVYLPLITIGEENMQCNNEKFKNDDLILHQLSYALLTLDALSVDLENKLNASYEKAKNTLSSTDSFYLTDRKEYLSNAIDIYFNAITKKDQSSLNSGIDYLKQNDPNILEIIEQIFPCDNSYLTKCKSSRESEATQILKVGQNCELEGSVVSNNILTTSLPRSSTKEVDTTIPTTLSTSLTTSTKTTTTSTSTKTTYTLPRFAETSKRTLTSTNMPTYTSDFNFYGMIKALNNQYDSTIDPFQMDTTKKNIDFAMTKMIDECKNLNENCDLWRSKGECARNRQFMNIECKKSCNLCNNDEKTSTKKLSTTKKIDLAVFENLCKDEFPYCPLSAARGDCKTNPHHMLDKCKRSCNLCGDLVQQKDRIQPITSTKKFFSRRVQIPKTDGYLAEDSPSQFDFWNKDLPEETSLKPSIIITTTYTSPTAKYFPRGSTGSNNNMRNQNNKNPTTTTFRTKTESIKNDCKDLVGHCPDLADRGDCISNEATMRYYCSKSCNFC